MENPNMVGEFRYKLGTDYAYKDVRRHASDRGKRHQ